MLHYLSRCNIPFTVPLMNSSTSYSADYSDSPHTHQTPISSTAMLPQMRTKGGNLASPSLHHQQSQAYAHTHYTQPQGSVSMLSPTQDPQQYGSQSSGSGSSAPFIPPVHEKGSKLVVLSPPPTGSFIDSDPDRHTDAGPVELSPLQRVDSGRLPPAYGEQS